MAVSRLEEVLETHADLAWLGRFFGARPQAEFIVVLGMLNGGSCYGARILPPKGPERLYGVLGVWATDWLGRPRFDQSMIPTVIHEFAHSYVNPVVYQDLTDLEAAGTVLYSHVEEAMKSQAYGPEHSTAAPNSATP